MRAILCTLAALSISSTTWADEEKVALDKLPKAVTKSVMKRFPKGELASAVTETVDKKTTYEVTLKDGGTTFDVNVDADGTITGMEKEVAVKDLPKVITDAVAAKHPKKKMKKGEEVIKVKDGKETLEYYEVFVEIDGKDVEVEVLPDGKLKPMEKK
jgi:hypothetical protein